MRTSFTTNNGYAPEIGPKVLPVYSDELDFSSVTSVSLDFVAELANGGVIAEIQCVYVDNLDNPHALTITIAETQFRIVAPAQTQGFYAIGGQASKITVESAGTTAEAVVLHFFNVPMPIGVWGPGTGSGGGSASVATGIGDADDVVMTGAADSVLPADPTRIDAIITADPANAASIRIGNIATVGATRGAELRPGAALTLQTQAEIAAFGTLGDTLSVTFTTV